jgi:hypothetical protein
MSPRSPARRRRNPARMRSAAALVPTHVSTRPLSPQRTHLRSRLVESVSAPTPRKSTGPAIITAAQATRSISPTTGLPSLDAHDAIPRSTHDAFPTKSAPAYWGFLSQPITSAPSGGSPVSRYFHNATNSFRANATIPIFR